MPQLIGIIFAIALAWVLFAVFLPAIIGLLIGGVWRYIINSNIEQGIVDAEATIRKTTSEIDELNNELAQGLKKKEEMLKDQRNIFLNNAISNLSKPTISFMHKLQEKYEIITSKYYLKDFSGNKINSDMEDSIDGKFPETLWSSDDFRKKFDMLFLKISKENLATENIETKILFKNNRRKYSLN